MKMFATLLMALSVGCAAETLHGLVVDVHDGDTIRVEINKVQHRVRLVGIDAPELDQLYGYASRTSLAEMTMNKRVTAECEKKDKYTRDLCTVYVGKLNINEAQIERGMAWSYSHYLPKGTPLKTIMDKAKAAKRGLWAEPDPIAPWDYRHNTRD